MAQVQRLTRRILGCVPALWVSCNFVYSVFNSTVHLSQATVGVLKQSLIKHTNCGLVHYSETCTQYWS